MSADLSPTPSQAAEFILADDLSGALEVAAAFAQAGRRVSCSLDPRAAEVGTGELPVLSTETRNDSHAAAENVVADVLGRMAALGARLVYKKIDSTLRGPLAGEIKAVVREYPGTLVVFCPVNPAAGRTVSDGVLRVGGVEVAQTAFARDPAWPIARSRVSEVVDPHGELPAASIGLAQIRSGAPAVAAALRQAAHARVRIVYCDGEREQDLRALIDGARQSGAPVVFVGAGGMARVLAFREGQMPAVRPLPLPTEVGEVIYVVGSQHPASHGQLSVLRAETRLKVFEFCPGAEVSGLQRALGDALRLEKRAALHFSPEYRGGEGGIAGLAALAVRCEKVNVVVATGGETAFALCRAWGVHALQVRGEFAPGVAVTEARMPGRRVTLVVKPGGFGGDDLFVQIQGWLDRSG